MATLKDVAPEVLRFLNFLNSTGSPYHLVDKIKGRLESFGFRRLFEGDEWSIRRGGKYYVIKNYSTIMGFTVGENFNVEHNGFAIVGSHSDSPCLKLKPNNNMTNEKLSQLGVQCYGGGLWRTWFDRGLGIAGKVLLKGESDIAVEEKLLRIPRPIAILPSLAIHLLDASERASQAFNDETHLLPVLCSKAKMDEEIGEMNETVKKADNNTLIPTSISLPLLHLISRELSCNIEDILDLDVCLMDATESRLCGIYEEFIESPRLDNSVSSFCSFEALTAPNANVDCNDICVAISFDHEEVGSVSFSGASSNTLKSWLERIAGCFGSSLMYPSLIARSFFLSSDMAHSVHPNYPSKHELNHKLYLNEGIVLKQSSRQAYSTSAIGNGIVRQVALLTDVKLQNFVTRNDMRCGSTIGPWVAANLGIPTADIGICQLAMHSCREMCGIDDLTYYIKFMKGFYKSFRNIYASANLL